MYMKGVVGVYLLAEPWRGAGAQGYLQGASAGDFFGISAAPLSRGVVSEIGYFVDSALL